MNKCIIFGGNGYIGTYLAKSLKKKYKVYSFGNLDFSNIKKNKFSYTFDNFKKKIKKINPNLIFFLSGNSYPNNSNNKHLYDLKRSNLVIQNFLNALKEISFKGKVIYTSSIAVYGKDDKFKDVYVNEKSNLNPKNFYGLSKTIAEKQFLYFYHNFGIKIYILRLSSIFGIDLKKQVIYEIIKKIIDPNEKIISMNGKENDSRQFLFIEDLIKILLKLISNKKDFLLLNISNGKKYKIKKITNFIMNKLNIKKKIIYKNKISPEFPILKNHLLMKEIKNFKFDYFYKSLEKTINYWNKQ